MLGENKLLPRKDSICLQRDPKQRPWRRSTTAPRKLQYQTEIETSSKYFNLIPIYPLSKRKFVDCPFVREKVIGSDLVKKIKETDVTKVTEVSNLPIRDR
jgi:hypothetical protein